MGGVSIIEAEMWAILHGVRLVKEIGLLNVDIHTSS